MAREHILHRVRTALGPQRRAIRRWAFRRCACACRRWSASSASGKCSCAWRRWPARTARTRDPLAVVAEQVAGKTAVASNAPLLAEWGITGLPGVRSGITDREELRDLCAVVDVGITSADYALADTGTLVMMSSPEEARLISLLPPAHLAVVPADRILTGLDELFTIAAQAGGHHQFDGVDHGSQPHGGYRADPGARGARARQDYRNRCRIIPASGITMSVPNAGTLQIPACRQPGTKRVGQRAALFKGAARSSAASRHPTAARARRICRRSFPWH